MGFIERDNKVYAIITADGALRIPSNEQNPLAEKRVVEKSDKSVVTKWELVKKGYKGTIESITFNEMDFGKMINVAFKLEQGEREQVVLSMNTASNYASDFMKKLPNVDLTKEISISPFSFNGDNGKNVKGITIWQGEDSNKVKVANFFSDGKTNLNGLPSPENGGQGFDKDDWKMYFTTVKKFLVKYTEDNIIPKLNASAMESFINDHQATRVEEEIKVDDIPFN